MIDGSESVMFGGRNGYKGKVRSGHRGMGLCDVLEASWFGGVNGSPYRERVQKTESCHVDETLDAVSHMVSIRGQL